MSLEGEKGGCWGGGEGENWRARASVAVFRRTSRYLVRRVFYDPLDIDAGGGCGGGPIHFIDAHFPVVPCRGGGNGGREISRDLVLF